MLGKDNTISNSTSATSAFFTKQEYEEGMDWWKDREGALPALYEYQVSCRDFPSGHGPDTCIYYMTIFGLVILLLQKLIGWIINICKYNIG